MDWEEPAADRSGPPAPRGTARVTERDQREVPAARRAAAAARPAREAPPGAGCGAGSGGGGGSGSAGSSGGSGTGSVTAGGAGVADGVSTPLSPDDPQAPATSSITRAAEAAPIPVLSRKAVPPVSFGVSCLPVTTFENATRFQRLSLWNAAVLIQRLCTVTGLMSPDGSKPKICPRKESSAAAAATIASAPRKPCCSPSKSR